MRRFTVMRIMQRIEEMAAEIGEKALSEYEYNGKTLREWVDEIANGDYVDVVRCKDCRHCDYSMNVYWCNRFDSAVQMDGMAYCSYAGRKRDD